MRLLLATLVLTVPAMAVAQDPIPRDVLDEHNRSCVSECMQTRERAYCVRTCNCVTSEIGQNWTMRDYEERAAQLAGDSGGSAFQDELTQLAAFCAQKAQ